MAKQSIFTSFGTVFEGENVTIEEAFERGGLNFSVNTQSLIRVPEFVLDRIKESVASGDAVDLGDWRPNRENLIVTHKSTFREDLDLTLGVVGSKYTVLQNVVALRFMNFVQEVSGQPLDIVSVGSLNGGRRIFVTAKLVGSDIYLSERDMVTPYIVFTTSHDGTGAVCAMITPVRVVCQNTLNMALRGVNSQKIVFRHTRNAEKKFDFSEEENRQRAIALFEGANSFSRSFLDRMLKLKNEQVDTVYTRKFIGKLLKFNNDQWDAWVKSNFSTQTLVNDKVITKGKGATIDELIYSIDDGIGQDFYRGTALHLLNGVTTWQQNHRSKLKEGEDEFKNKFEGTSLTYTQRAYDLLTSNNWEEVA